MPLSRSPYAHNNLISPDLGSYQVLAQNTATYLLQDPHTQTFHVYEQPTDTVFCTTEHWPIAYRAWLSLSRRYSGRHEPSPLENLSLTELKDWISRNQDQPEFGQLLYSCDRHYRGLLQYAVRISADVAMLWVPSQTSQFSVGQLALQTISRRRHRLAKWVDQPLANEVGNAMLQSLDIFHQRWSFNIYQFNSEHWARLVATRQCCSLQTDNLLAYWQSVSAEIDLFSAAKPPDIWESNPEAEARLKIAIVP